MAVVVVSDLHFGSSTALCPPHGIVLEDGGRYMPNAAQKWIWSQWLAFWAVVREYRKRRVHTVIVMNGEFIDGFHHESTQLATNSPEIMADAALESFSTVAAIAHELFATLGTEAHSGKGAASDRSIARQLGARVNPETGQHAFYELDLLRGGILFDIAHHVSGGSRYTTRGNGIRAELIDMLVERPEVNVVVRSHVHTFAETGRNFGPRRHGVVTPAWQLKTAFGSRVTRQRVTQVGGIIYELQAGEFNFRPILYDVPKRNPM